MISLRKYLDADAEGLVKSTMEAYRKAIVAMGSAGVQACPPAGDALQVSLLNLHQRLLEETSKEVVNETGTQLETELQHWAQRSAKYYADRTNDVKEILTMVAKTASDVGERDERYGKQLQDLTKRLQATALLPDIRTIRESLGKDVSDFTSCLENMAQDGMESVAQLRAKVSRYEARLEEVEVLASQDDLTGLANRRKVERQLERRIQDGRKFSVIYLDLNGFKEINDVYGHLAGDDLLKQFAGELQTAFRTDDVIGRWGGDEFIVLVDGERHEDQLRKRIEDWVNGDYILAGPEQQKVTVSAAVGTAAWVPGMSATELVRQADGSMYAEKQSKAAGRANAAQGVGPVAFTGGRRR